MRVPAGGWEERRRSACGQGAVAVAVAGDGGDGDHSCCRRCHGTRLADAAARGCSGLSIAQGLCDLGAEVPVVVVASAQQSREGTRGRTWRVVRPDNAAQTVKRLARSRRRRRNQQCAPQLASA